MLKSTQTQWRTHEGTRTFTSDPPQDLNQPNTNKVEAANNEYATPKRLIAMSVVACWKLTELCLVLALLVGMAEDEDNEKMKDLLNLIYQILIDNNNT